LRPAFLHVYKRTGQLYQSLIEGTVRAVLVLEPQMLQDFMGLIEKLLVETLKIAQIMRVQFLSVMIGDHLGNAFALAAHTGSLNRTPRGDETHSEAKIRDGSRRLLHFTVRS
jgi:hypothetical protein